MTVHGDDFLAVADFDQIKWIEEQLKGEYAIMAGVLWPEPELSKGIKILNRFIRWCGNKLEYEADSRHAEIIIEECQVQSWRAAKTPRVQEAVVDGIEKGGVEMNDHEKTRFRGGAARINYLATDRSDPQFAAKELCRKMAKPEPKDWDKARRIARYLKFRPPCSLGVPIRAAQRKVGWARRQRLGRREALHEINGWRCAEVRREYLEIVVKHADYRTVEFGRSGTLCHEQVRPTIGIFDKYRKGFRDRAECSGSQRRYCRSRDRVQARTRRQHRTCQGAVLVYSGRG